MQAGVKGVKIMIAGRLGGAEMSRTLDIRLGSLPLSTLQANIDYGFAEAFMSYGAIGVKVWIYKGMYGTAPSEEEVQSTAAGGRRAWTSVIGRGPCKAGLAELEFDRWR